jgi:hypothetical protein
MLHARRIGPLYVGFGLLLGPTPGCDGSDGDDDGTLPACVSRDPAACAPLYAPTFANVHASTLMPRCGTAGSACHAGPDAMGASGGMLVTGDVTQTYQAIFGNDFVVAGDAPCSVLMVRLDVDDDALRMPPGSSGLPEGERCAVAQWIDAGAEP